MQAQNEPNFLPTAAVVIAGAFLLFLVCRPTDPNAELARTTREAVQLARDAQTSSESAALWAGRFRLLTVVVGVSAPLIVAYLIWRASAASELDPAEVIEAIEQDRLLPPVENAAGELSTSSPEALPVEAHNTPAD